MKTFLVLFSLLSCSKALDYSFVGEGSEVTKLQNEEVSFRCEVQGVDYEWQNVAWLNGTFIMFYNRKPSTRGSRITVLDAEGNVNLAGSGDVQEMRITNLSVLDEGTYTCQVSGEHIIEQKHVLTVNIPPVIEMTPNEQKLDMVLGQSVDVACKVMDGKPAVIVTWSRTDDAAVFENGEAFFTGETLSFPAVEKHHTGTYTCLASNGAGEDVTEKIKLNVMYKPNVTIDEPTVYTGPGRTTEIICYFDANPEVAVEWKHDGEVVDTAVRTNIKAEPRDDGSVALIISDVTEADLGVYLCIGNNEKGVAEAVIKLSALPYGLEILSEVQSLYSDSYYLEWQVESVAPLKECNLRVQGVNSSGEFFLGNNTIPAQLNAMTHNYQITGLEANGTYNLELDCVNAFGSTPTRKLEIYTSSQDRPAPPPTIPTTVKEVEEKTEGMKEMNTLDESSKEATTVTEDPGNLAEKSVTDDPTGAAQPVAMAVANLMLLLGAAIVLSW